jgi:hypothetical protein
MEALLEKEEGQMENWNDDRLDELSQTVKEGFAKTDREMKEGFAKVDREMKEGFARLEKAMREGFEQVDKRFEQVDGRFEVVEGRFFTLMIAILVVVGGGVISALLAVN